MINPLNDRHLEGLARAVDYSRWRLQPFRENRLQLLKNFVGAHYSGSGAPQRVPLNLLQLAANIYLRQLVSKAPRAMVTARRPDLKPIAADFQAWSDRATTGMRLPQSFRICVLNALFSLGIMKIGNAYAGQMDILGTTVSVGQCFAEPVDLDDWVADITAKRYDQVQFAGNRYRVPLSQARANPQYDVTARNQLMPQTKFAYNERGDVRTTTLQQSTLQLTDEYEEHVELWDIFLPREKLVLTMPYQDSAPGGFINARPLAIVDWTGPRQGPFVLLSYSDVPNNWMPAAPLQALLDLHELVNLLWRKLARQGERQKTLLGFMGTATDDAERINRANDGDAVRFDFPDRAKEFDWGGIKPENLAATIQAKDLFVYMAGNLDALGGLSPQAATLGQDELLTRNASAQVAQMQDVTIDFTREVYQHTGHHWWHNPVLYYEATREVAGFPVPVQITPQMRQVPWEMLDVDVDPYSAQPDTPQTRLALMLKLLGETIMPAMPQIAQQGGQLDWQAILADIGRYGNFPGLAEWLKWGPPPAQQGPMQVANQAADAARMPPVTTRRNVRINRPQMTRQGQSDVMMNMLRGSASPQQAGMAGRPAA